MKFSHLMTPKRIEQYTNWLPTGAVYMATAFTALVYFTDWKVIADKIPFYNSKFKTQ